VHFLKVLGLVLLFFSSLEMIYQHRLTKDAILLVAAATAHTVEHGVAFQAQGVPLWADTIQTADQTASRS
jgi:hypothetical protein